MKKKNKLANFKMDKTSIKQEIIKFLESQGPKSKSKIEDYIRAEMGTNGDTTSRRMRELVSAGVLRKDLREFEGKKYWEYSVVELPKPYANIEQPYAIPGFEGTLEQLEKLNL